MNRRELMLFATATVTLPLPLWAQSGAQTVEFSPKTLEKHLAAGHVVFLDFKAEWCSTCKTQERVLKKLKKDNPNYGQKVVFMDVDWDMHRDSDLVKELRIPRRSTLVVLKGENELGRLVAITSEKEIKALVDTAVAAAG